MKTIKYILPVLILLTACRPDGKNPDIDGGLKLYDSIFVSADLQWHKQYYPNLDCEVFSIDLLSEGLAFDSAFHINGTGCNLYISDIFLPCNSMTLQDGLYHMDTTAQPYTFLPYMYFEGEVTGTYLLDIKNSNLNRIIGFTAGEMKVHHSNGDINLDITLYVDTANNSQASTYHATYHGPAIYR